MLKLILFGVTAVIAISYWIYEYLDKEFGDKFSLCTSSARLDGKVTIITGASSGIGRETARNFASRGAKVYLAVRNKENGQETADEIIASTGNHNVHVLILNLSSLKSVVDFAKQFKKKENRLDILVNNAGVYILPRLSITEDGFEEGFQINYLGHFLLTTLLLDLMKRSSPARIVNVSSVFHTKSKMKFDDINCKKRYDAFEAHGQSKLALILFTRTLAKKLEGTGVTAFALHPGGVKTEGSRRPIPGLNWSDALTHLITSKLLQHFGKTPEQGAQTSIYCAVSEGLETSSGLYFVDCEEKKPSKDGRDDVKAYKLWDYSMELVEPFLKM